MANIEEHVVSMEFRNKNFQRGANETLSTIERLKRGLNFRQQSKSLQELDQSAKKIDLRSVASSVDYLASRFSALGITGTAVLFNLANTAVSAGARIIKSLTIDPVMAGFQEYETQINAVQTILANTSNKGTNLKQVNAALDELNLYADKTIYNFTEMTRNIGTFTAAGVDLNTSVQAIKGIANLAAVSGSNSQQASTAMYQLSQALSTGTVKLMDWNSVVNAGMGGQVFQDAIKETARVHGVAVDQIIEEEGSFRDSLQKGWLTSEILLDTLNKFTGDLNEEQLRTMGYTEDQIAGIIKMGQTANDAATKVKTFSQLISTLQEAAQSGWTQTWEILFGDFEEAKELFTGISDYVGGIINDTSNARNSILSAWKDLGGRRDLFQGIKNIWDSILEILKPISEAFRSVFPPVTVKTVYDLTRGFLKLTESLKISGATSYRLGVIFKGIFSAIQFGQKLFHAFYVGVRTALKPLMSPEIGGGLLKYIGKLATVFTDLNNNAKLLDSIRSKINLVASAIARVIQYLIDLWSAWKPAFSSMLTLVTSVVTGIVGLGKALGGGLLDIFQNGAAGGEALANRLSARFEHAKKIGSDAKKFILDTFNGIKEVLLDWAPFLSSTVGRITSALGKLWDALKSAVSSVDFNSGIDIANLGILSAIGIALKKFLDGLSDIGSGGILGSIKDILDGVSGSLEAMQTKLKAEALMSIAIAVGILTASVVALSLIDSAKLTIALTAITTMFAQLFGATGILAKVTSGKGIADMAKVTTSMILLSVAIGLLTGSVVALSKLDLASLGIGLLGIGVIMGLMAGTAAIMDRVNPSFVRTGVSLIIFAGAVRVLVGAVEQLGALDLATLAKGLLGVGALLAEIAVFMKVADFGSGGIRAGVGIIAMSVAIRILVSAVDALGSMDTSAVAQGTIAIGALIAAMTLASKFSGGGSIAGATGMVIMAAAMVVLSTAIERIGSLDLATLAKGFITIALSMAVMGAALALIPATSIVSAGAMLIMSAALVVLAGVLETIGGMPLANIAQGLIAMTLALVVLAGAMYLMSGGLPGAAAMVVMAGALAILTPVLTTLGSMSLAEIGTALLALVGAFLVLGVAGLALTPVVPTLLGLGAAILLIGAGAALAGVGLMAAGVGLTAIGAGGAAAAVGLTAIATALLNLIPLALTKLGEGIVALAGVIRDGAPAIIEALVAILDGLIKAVGDLTPTIIETLTTMVMSMVDAITENVPLMVDSGLQMIQGILDGIASNIGGIVDSAVNVITEFVGGVSRNLGKIIDSGVELIFSFIDGIGNAIRQNGARMGQAGADLAGDIIAGMADGIWAGVSSIAEAAMGVARSALDSAKSFLGIASPSKEFIKIGKWTSKGMAIGIRASGYEAKNASKGMARDVLKYATNALSAIDEAIKNMDSSPKITPKIDLGEFNEGIDEMNRQLGGDHYGGIRSRINDIRNPNYKGPSDPAQVVKKSYNFTQNIHAPKSPSRIDLYRHGQNLIRQAAYA